MHDGIIAVGPLLRIEFDVQYSFSLSDLDHFLVNVRAVLIPLPQSFAIAYGISYCCEEHAGLIPLLELDAFLIGVLS